MTGGSLFGMKMVNGSFVNALRADRSWRLHLLEGTRPRANLLWLKILTLPISHSVSSNAHRRIESRRGIGHFARSRLRLESA